ncbi:MAG: low molecular weight phosphotyrosine protein phosphatase [Anaerolineae bacterium]|nr:low molecular weight phosphotyrosine protein phosphatase [Anaerolineae bacterium]
MIRVLFVCLGNICRSPMAEAVFAHLVAQAGLSEHFQIDSCGTSDYHQGDQAHSGTLKVLAQHGIDYHGRSRPLTPQDLAQFDYVLAMDQSNLTHIQRLAGGDQAKIILFLNEAYQLKTVDRLEVPDPYYTGGFERVYQLVYRGSEALLTRIRQDHQI